MHKTIIFFTLSIAVTSVLAQGRAPVFPNCVRGDADDNTVVTPEDLEAIQKYIDGSGELSCHGVLHSDINLDRSVDQLDVDELIAAFALDEHGGVFGIQLQGNSWGDINGDGSVTEYDIDMLSRHVDGTLPFLPTIGFETGDISGDGMLSLLDLDIFIRCDEDTIRSPFPFR